MILLPPSGSKTKFSSIENIRVKEPEVKGDVISAKYLVDGEEVSLSFKYDFPVVPQSQDLRMIFLIPLVNYSLFTGKIEADFPISIQDKEFLEKMMVINSREVYVNKIIRRKEFFREESVPVSPNNSEASFSPEINVSIEENERVPYKRERSVALLSSGGKDSLLSYGLMREIGANVYPIYINESGGHWRTASTAYEHMRKNSQNTIKVWTTIDRFYRKMNSKVKILNERALTMWSDTYPIQLFLFPVYIFSIIPYVEKFRLAAIMKGDEFDDPREFVTEHGIRHYYGIYDQTQAFDLAMNEYFQKIGYGLIFYSVVRSISGLMEERILFDRYPELAKLQRSCHSCHVQDGQMVPCGRCSKCNGVLLFLLASSLNPARINYREEDIRNFKETYSTRVYNLDKDEREHSEFLFSKGEYGQENIHVEKIHESQDYCNSNYIDEEWRDKIMEIIEKYTKGHTYLENGQWI